MQQHSARGAVVPTRTGRWYRARSCSPAIVREIDGGPNECWDARRLELKAELARLLHRLDQFFTGTGVARGRLRHCVVLDGQDDHRLLAVDGHALRPLGLRAPDDLAEAGLGVLQLPGARQGSFLSAIYG